MPDPAAGAIIYASDFDNVFNPPCCRAWHSAAATLTTATSTVIALASETYDSTGSMHSTSSNTSRIIAPVAGKYHIVASIGFASNSTGRRICAVRLNAAGSSASGTLLAEKVGQANSSNIHTESIAFDYDLAASDYVELFALQQSGGNLNTSALEHQSWLSIRYVGPSS